MDKDTAISKIYQILEIANISVKELIEIIKPAESVVEEVAELEQEPTQEPEPQPTKKSNKK